MIKRYFKGIYQNRYILIALIRRDLQMKYRRSKLGVAWSILTPLGLVLIIGTVYSIVFGEKLTDFIPQVFAGLLPWLCINTTLEGATLSFMMAEGYIKQSTVSIQIFPIRLVMVNFVNLLFSVLAYFSIYLFLKPQNFAPLMLITIPGLMIMFLFCLGFSNIAAVINLNIRDFQPLLSLMMQGVFYATPIIYPASKLAEKGFAWVYQCNPFYYMIEVVRAPMLGIQLPETLTYFVSVGLAVVLFIISIVVIMKAEKTVAYKL